MPTGRGKNLAAEAPNWEFDKTRASAREIWRKQIAKIQVASPNETHKRIFYTALYHLSLGPTLFDDVDGRYRGMDNQNPFACYRRT